MFLCISSTWNTQDSRTLFTEDADRLILWIIAPIPLMYPLALLLCHIYKKSRRIQTATEWIRAFFSRPNSYQNLEHILLH